MEVIKGHLWIAQPAGGPGSTTTKTQAHAAGDAGKGSTPPAPPGLQACGREAAQQGQGLPVPEQCQQPGEHG